MRMLRSSTKPISSRWTSLWTAAQCLLLLGFLANHPSQAVYSQGYRNDQDQPWNKYLTAETLRLAERTDKELAEVTKENWPETKAKWRSELQDMLGLNPWPERGPLNARVTKQVELDSITVQNLVFEPSPALYATANLYLPKGTPPKGGWPSVVYVCGHARADEFGRLLGNKTGYQHHGLWLARHGFVCIIVDTIQLGEFQGEHHGTYSQGRWDWVTKGYTPAGIEAWIAIRSLELLAQRDDVHPDKIGITGRSGGGAYSWYAAALDDRFQVAVPVAGITDLQDHVIEGCIEGHCDCMFMINKHQWDFGKLAALIAPRPLMLTNTDSDSIFPLSGVFRIHNQIRRLYSNLGASSRYGLLIAPGPHQDSQELQVGAFKWLALHLTGQELVVESAAVKELTPKQLVAFPAEMPSMEKVTNASRWFVSKKGSTPESWQNEGLKWLEAVWKLGQDADTSEQSSFAYETDQRGSTSEFDWAYVRELDSQGWARGWIEIRPKANSDLFDPKVLSSSKVDSAVQVHLGAWRGCKLYGEKSADSTRVDSERINTWLTEGELASKLQANPQAIHYCLLPRGWGLEKDITDLRELTQLHRRFYLLGDSLEQLQMRDDWRSISAIAEKQQSPQIDLVGYNRSGILAGFIAWRNLNLHDEQGHTLNWKANSLRLEGDSHDPRLYACLPGFAQAWNVSDVFASLGSLIDVSRGGSILDPTKLLVIDSAIAPQQATGSFVQLKGGQSAVISARATRLSLANLGDLNPLPTDFREDLTGGSQENLPPDLDEGIAYAVPGIAAEVRFRWRETGTKEWQGSSWELVGGETDFWLSKQIDALKPGAVYEYLVEARKPGTEQISSSSSGSFLNGVEKESEAGRAKRWAFSSALHFDDRDGPFGFDALRAMQSRKVNWISMGNSAAESVPMDWSERIAKQRLYGLKSVIDLNRRIPLLSGSDQGEAMLVGGDGSVWFVDQFTDALLDDIQKSKRSKKLLVTREELPVTWLNALKGDAKLFIVWIGRPGMRSHDLDSGGAQLFEVGPISVRGVQRLSEWEASTPSGNLSERFGASAGYFELEIPDSTATSRDWILRHVNPQGNVLSETQLK